MDLLGLDLKEIITAAGTLVGTAAAGFVATRARLMAKSSGESASALRELTDAVKGLDTKVEMFSERIDRVEQRVDRFMISIWRDEEEVTPPVIKPPTS